MRLPVSRGFEGFWNGWAALCYYPLSVWNGVYEGSLHFYGHVDARMLDTQARIDVGVDSWAFAPVRLEAVLARMRVAELYVSPESEPMPEKDDS